MKSNPSPWWYEFTGTSTGKNPVNYYNISNHWIRIAENVMEVDAPLIASAPELLVALQHLLKEYVEILGDAVGDHSTACALARDAIANATSH